MGLTRLAQDPWSETVTVPQFTPPPVETKSCHVPLTAERAEELVKTHLQRTGVSVRRSRDLPAPDPSDPNATGLSSGAAPPSQNGDSFPPCLENATGASVRAAGSLSSPCSPFMANLVAAGASPADLGSPRHHTGRTGPGTGDLVNDDDDGGLSGQDGSGTSREGDGLRVAALGSSSARCKALDAALVDAWMREAAVVVAEPEENFTFNHAADGPDTGAARAARRPLRPGSREGQPSRRLSCPESLLSIHGASDGGASSHLAAPEPEGEVEPKDALEPLANHNMWMFNRGRMQDGGLGLLYSPAGVVLPPDVYGEGMAGGWQPRDAASIFADGGWDASAGGSGTSAASKRRTRISKLAAEGAGVEVVRTLAAVIIQSYCRGWHARRRVARMRSMLRSEESRRLKERAAAEALAREREIVRRKLRTAAKDCLLAVQAQQDYDRTRARMAAARGLTGGAAAAPPPPPPTIPALLWERCKGLGQDPIAVLLESGLQSHQIEEIIAASRLAAQLPRRAAAVAARLGVPLPPVPEGSSRAASAGSGGGGASAAASTGGARAAGRSSYGGSPMGGKSGSASDDGGASAAAAVAGGVLAAAAAAASRGGMPPLARRLSLPGRPLLPSQRSLAVPSAATMLPPKQPPISTSQLVEQMLAEQQATQMQLQQQVPQLAQGVSGRPFSGHGPQGPGLGPAVRRTSGPGALTGGGGGGTGGAGAGAPLRRQPSPSRGSLAASVSVDGGSGQLRIGLQPGLIPGGHMAGGYAVSTGMSPSRGPPVQLPPQLALGLSPTRASVPVPGLRGTSRRMSDFVGAVSSSGGGAVQGTALSLAAVGSSAMSAAAAAAAAAAAPVRARSFGVSDSGGAVAVLSSGLTLPVAAVGGRVVLPAVPQGHTSISVGNDAAAASGDGGGPLGTLGSADLKSGGSGGAGAAAAASLAAAPALSQSASAPPSGLPLAEVPLQESQAAPGTAGQKPQQMHPPHHLPQHLQGLLASALSSPVTRSGAPSSSGCSVDGSPALLRRHSFVENVAVSGAKSSPNSFTTGGAVEGGAAALARSANAAAAAAAMVAANKAGIVGTAGGAAPNGGGGGGSGSFMAHLPPLMPSQGSGSLAFSSGGGSSGAASPSAAAAAAMAGGSPHAASATATAGFGSGAATASALSSADPSGLLRIVRRGSNLAPQGSQTPAAAAPPPGPPPSLASPKNLRRLKSLTHANASAAAAALAAIGAGGGPNSGGSPPPALTRVLSVGGADAAGTAALAAAAVAAANDAAAAPRAALPLPPTRPPVPGPSPSRG